jgi:hypothetical protein
VLARVPSPTCAGIRLHHSRLIIIDQDSAFSLHGVVTFVLGTFDSGEKRSVKFSGGRHRQRVTWENPEFIGPGRPEGKVILPTLIRNDA